MPSLPIQRNMVCPHCRGSGLALGGLADDDDADGEASASYDDERDEFDRGMRALDAYSGRGVFGEAGFAGGGMVGAEGARRARIADKGGESNATNSFAGYLARRRGVRALYRGGKAC
jgi:hypothetical protein